MNSDTVVIGEGVEIRETLEKALKSKINFADRQLIIWLFEYCKELEDKINTNENK